MTDDAQRQWDAASVDGRLTNVERFVARAEPAIFDSETGLVTEVRELREWRIGLDAQIRLIKWAVAFAGVGLVFQFLDIAGHAAGILK